MIEINTTWSFVTNLIMSGMMMMMMMMTMMAGINLRTGDKGIFPLAHVVDVDYNDFDPAGVEVRVCNYIASSVTVAVFISAANRSIGEVVQSRRRPLLSYSRLSLMIIASRTQFHIYLSWGQRLFSIVS